MLIAAFSDSPSDVNPDAPLSVAVAVQNLLLAAWSEGLGSCWFTSGLYAVQDTLSAHLGVQDMELVGLVVLTGIPGRYPPTFTPAKRTGRMATWSLKSPGRHQTDRKPSYMRLPCRDTGSTNG